MSLAAGTTSIPIMIGLIVGVVAFLAWATAAVRRQRAETAATAAMSVTTVAAPALPVRPQPAPVRAVVHPYSVSRSTVAHYSVAAPDDDAVRVAMMLRVRPPVPFPVPTPVEVAPERMPAAVRLPRSA